VKELIDFLRARYDEEHIECRQQIADGHDGERRDSGWSPNQVLRQLFVQQLIINLAGTEHDWAALDALDEVYKLLALPYVGHPNFRKEWLQ
jgi:Family of unknown function (DUF6221)